MFIFICKYIYILWWKRNRFSLHLHFRWIFYYFYFSFWNSFPILFFYSILFFFFGKRNDATGEKGMKCTGGWSPFSRPRIPFSDFMPSTMNDLRFRFACASAIPFAPLVVFSSAFNLILPNQLKIQRQPLFIYTPGTLVSMRNPFLHLNIFSFLVNSTVNNSKVNSYQFYFLFYILFHRFEYFARM